MTACTLIGNQIGNGDVKQAKRFYWAINQFSFVIQLLMIATIIVFEDPFFRVFT